jgi:UrcA family protein
MSGVSRKIPTAALIAVAVAGLLSTAAPVSAQPYGAYGTYEASPPPEEVIVTAPRPHAQFREEGGGGLRSMDVPPEKVSLTTHVRYDDLDLMSPDGARELRTRVREAAHGVCRDLTEAYPFYRIANSPSCYHEAVDRALVHANEAIARARADYYYYSYDE